MRLTILIYDHQIKISGRQLPFFTYTRSPPCFKVRLSAYKDNKEVAYVVFDSMGKSRNDWLDCGRIIESSYTDITTATKNYCEMK